MVNVQVHTGEHGERVMRDLLAAAFARLLAAEGFVPLADDEDERDWTIGDIYLAPAAGVTPDLAAPGLPPRPTRGTEAQRAEQRSVRHQRSALAHRERQTQRDAERAPTRKLRHLLWHPGGRRPAPKSRAAGAALVAELRDGPYACRCA